MVDTGSITGIGSEIANRIMSGAVWVLALVIVGGGVAGLMYYFLIYKRKFDILVTIRSERSGKSTVRRTDYAAILTDRKTHERYFKLWKYKIEMPIPHFDVLEHAEGKDYLDLYQKGDSEFYFLKPPEVDRTYIEKTDGSVIPWAEQQNKVVDSDIAFWAQKKKKENWFDKDKLIWRVLEFAPQIISTVTLIFILWIFLDKLPPILNGLKDIAAQFQQVQRADITTSLIPLLFIKYKNGLN